MRARFISFVLVSTAGFALAGHTAAADVLPEGWGWRRPISIRPMTSDAPGDNIGWVEFYANGAQQSDGADIRVTNAERAIVPSRILQVSSDNDFFRVAFETKGDGPYFVWWGNPKAQKPALDGEKELEIKRGIFLEVSRAGPAGGRGRAAAGQLVDMPQGPILGSYFLPDLDLGYNPFGDERQVMLRYRGQFKIDRAVTAQIAFTVNDMAVLDIDGKEIDRQIRTGLRGQVRQSVPVELAAGWHTLEIRQVNLNQGNLVMAMAWQQPGQKGFSPLPASMFAPAAHGIAGALEKVGAQATADMSVEATAEDFLPPNYYGQRYTFDAQFPSNMKPTITWDFGDGQTSTGLKKASHLYLAPGTYPVTLKLQVGGNEMKTTVRVPVQDRMYERFPRPLEDPPATTRSMLRDEKPETLPAEQAFRGMMFFEMAGDPSGPGAARNQAEVEADGDARIVWGKAWLAAKGPSQEPDNVIFDETCGLSRLLVQRKQFADAADVFRMAAAKPIGMETRANLMRLQVMTLCDYTDDADAAVKEAQAWLKKISESNKLQVQTVQAALAYAQIAKGDGKAAKAAIDAGVAARGNPGGSATDAFNRRQVRQGVLTRNVENYIQTKDLDTALGLLNDWELEFPEAIWDGFTRTLRVKLAVAEGRNLAAARMALAHARANPDGFYAAELLYRAAENFKLTGEGQQAATVMEMLKDKYPESPYARGDGSGK